MTQPLPVQPETTRTSPELRVSPTIWFAILLGLLIAFPTIISPLLHEIHAIDVWAGLSTRSVFVGSNLLFQGVQIALIFGIVAYIERRPLKSLGLTDPGWTDLGLGLAIFAALIIAGGAYVLALRRLFPHTLANVAQKQFGLLVTMPLPAAIALAVGAGFAEEICERGFVLDRIDAATRNAGVAIVVVLALSLAAHIAFWGWRYAILLAVVTGARAGSGKFQQNTVEAGRRVIDGEKDANGCFRRQDDHSRGTARDLA